MVVVVPESEKYRFEAIISAAASKYGLSTREYLRKIWYHEEAAKLGEYVALVLTEHLASLVSEAEIYTASIDDN